MKFFLALPEFVYAFFRDPQLQSLNALLGGITQLTDLKQGAMGQAEDAGIDTAALLSQLRGNLAAGRVNW